MKEVENIAWQKSFERNMNHNYLVLSNFTYFAAAEPIQDYRIRMLLENPIEGLLRVSHRTINAESRYYYEINSLQSLDRICERKELGYQEFAAVISGCIALFDRLEQYLLDGMQVLLSPEYIYLHAERLEAYFVYYPAYQGDARQGFCALIEELLTRIDHTDDKAVMLAYQIYRYTRNPNYVLSEIKALIHTEPAIQESQSPIPELICKDFDRNPMEEMYETGTQTTFFDTEEEEEPEKEKEKGSRIQMIGCVICFLTAVLAGLLFLGGRSRILMLSMKQEIAVFGAASMALVAGILFLADYIRKRREEKELLLWQGEEETEQVAEPYSQQPLPKQPEFFQTAYYGDTVVLRQESANQKILKGQAGNTPVEIALAPNQLPMIIGKLAGRADYVLQEETVSKMHARLEEKDGTVYISDLNSTNGTYKNGQLLALHEAVPLETGDTITLGRVRLTCCDA